LKKPSVGEAFNSKTFRYGTRSTISIVIVTALLISLNIAASYFNVRLDLSRDKLYSITEESTKILNDIKNPTKIYAFYEPGKVDAVIKIILDMYSAQSDKISVKYFDPETNPALVQKYSKLEKTVEYGSIVVESEKRYKLISSYELVNTSIDELGQAKADSFAAEQQLTNAITYVNSDKEQILYTLVGHQEKEVSEELKRQLYAENYIIKELNLLQSSSKLNKEDLLIIISPMKDLSSEEAEKIKKFLSEGGRAAFFIDITQDLTPNIQEVLWSYGIKTQNHLVIEGDAQYIADQPAALLPEIKDHVILNAIKANKLPIYMPVSQGIEEIKEKKKSIKIEALLSTTSNSWAKTRVDTTFDKEEGDIEGPINVAVAVTDEEASLNKKTKLIVVGSSTFVDSDINTMTKGTNIDFAMNCLNWLQDREEGIAIRPKNLASFNFTINEFQKLIISGTVVILIPLTVFIIGFIVWVKRRHK
jgi:ABC-type uncharacterized transport system involved in gliding motility auxiliary subunit